MWPYTTVETGATYKQPDCAVTIGGLTNTTRLAMGFKLQHLWTIQAKRIWIMTMETPFNDVCEMNVIRNLLERSTPLQCTLDRLTRVCLYLWEDR
jgi:hypothetical protein